MLIAEVSQRRIIAIVTNICFILTSCFSVLSGTITALVQSLGKQEKEVPENVQGDVYQEEINILKNCLNNNCEISLDLNKNEHIFKILDKEFENSKILVSYIHNKVLAKPLTVS